MNIIKKIYISVYGKFDNVVDRMQNNDALVSASLIDLKNKIKESRITFGELTRTLDKLKKDLEVSKLEYEKWIQRAKEKGALGEREVALECIRRAHNEKRSIEMVERQIKSSLITHQTVGEKLKELETLNKTLTLKHKELKARENSEITNQFIASDTTLDTEEMLNKWEDKLGILNNQNDDIIVDTMKSEFELNENLQQLNAELDSLLN